MKTKLLMFFLVFLLIAVPLRAETVNVAAASDLSFALDDIIRQFERSTGHRINLSTGSSGNLYAQIIFGAPVDVFLSADMELPKQLEAKALAVPGSTFVYGIGRLAYWVPKKSSLNLDKLGMTALLDESVHKIAIANPDHAPYGQAAVHALTNAKLYDRVKPKLVYGENTSQALEFVQTGAADIGVVPVAFALAPTVQSLGRYWMVPADLYPPIQQGAVLLKRAGPGGKAFHEWLKGPEARRILEKFGFKQ